VRLPLTDKRPEREPAPPIPAIRAPLRAGGRIAIVEDSADSRELLCELLSHEGFECETAETGPAGLALIEQTQPAIAILDVGLPEMDGYEVARRLRADPRHASMFLIALTGYGQATDRAASREAGFDEHLVKPVDVDELLHLLATLKREPLPVEPPGKDDELAL
jgi:two-component system CheB/CheR fusion protein